MRARLEEGESAETPAEHSVDYRLLARLLHAEMMNEQFVERAKETQALCEQLRTKVRHDDDFIHATVAASLINARRHQFHIRDWVELQTEATTHFDRSGSAYGPVWLETIVGTAKLLSGNIPAAEEKLKLAMERAIQVKGPDAPLTAMPALMLSEIYYEWNRVGEAQELIDRYLPRAGELGLSDQVIAGYIVQARIYADNTEIASATETLDFADQYAKAKGLDRLHMHVVAERLRQTIINGDIETALRIAKHEGLFERPEQFFPHRDATLKDEIRMIAWTRAALARDAADIAVPVLKRWLRFADDRECHRSTVQVAIQLAKAMFLTGDSPGAKRTLRLALDRARQGRLVRAFLDEGPSIVDSLVDISVHSSSRRDLISESSERIVAQSNASAEQRRASSRKSEQNLHPIEPLTGRQIDILRRVSDGCRNREIADDLGLTVGTVKWHLQQVFDHLGIRGRVRAAQRAREIGIIP